MKNKLTYVLKRLAHDFWAWLKEFSAAVTASIIITVVFMIVATAIGVPVYYLLLESQFEKTDPSSWLLFRFTASGLLTLVFVGVPSLLIGLVIRSIKRFVRKIKDLSDEAPK